MADNMQLDFFRQIKLLQFAEHDQLLLIVFCHLLVNNDDDSVGFHDFERFYHRTMFSNIKHSMNGRHHPLFEQGLLENVNNDGLGDREFFRLTDKAKTTLLAELNLKEQHGTGKKDLMLSTSISAKELFYNEKEYSQIQQLTALLQVEHFKTVQQNLSAHGMRAGFACLFYGAPGTGKTETVYQLARATGRDVMMVDISETKSMWFGESEKRIKAIFDRYRGHVKSSKVEPILLFNEADAVIGKRKDVTAGAVAQTENAIQNIILQEMENMEGIMIATTNLTQNLDNAFERRFLYKIEFGKPATAAKKSIWLAMMPTLSEHDAAELAEVYDFSGGQIENIARKHSIDSIINGHEPSLEAIHKYCSSEQLAKSGNRPKIGFLTQPEK
jgi:hypothetical protein